MLREDVRSFKAWARLLGRPLPKPATFKSGLQFLGINSWDVTLEEIAQADPKYTPFCSDPRLAERVKIEAVYDEFIAVQREEVEAVRRDHALAIPADIDYYDRSLNLSNEVRGKLQQARPATVSFSSSGSSCSSDLL
ncbi:Protein MTO1, mitochondrial [Portunus trituberculatus]|uniref:Protein MTO1, mitochondrial n=1 Tax=Portunus trituberculatus TaxID=210409 RepID=A0A5B7HL01_PORTR|nr:Protein MTO1, mitochondrial [Portunus trituberculatus]